MKISGSRYSGCSYRAMKHLAFEGKADRIRKLPMRGLPEEPTVRCARRRVVMLVFELLASVRDPTFEQNGLWKNLCWCGLRWLVYRHKIKSKQSRLLGEVPDLCLPILFEYVGLSKVFEGNTVFEDVVDGFNYFSRHCDYCFLWTNPGF